MVERIMSWVNTHFIRKRDLQALLRIPRETLMGNIRIKQPGTQGSVALMGGTATRAGYIEWRLPHEDDDVGTRLGYMGWSSNNLNIHLENGNPLVIDGGVTRLFPALPRVARQISNGSVSAANAGTLVPVPETGTTDELDTITDATADGQILVLRVPGGRSVTVKNNTGNIRLEGDFVMNSRADRLTLQWDQEFSRWCEIARANGV